MALLEIRKLSKNGSTILTINYLEFGKVKYKNDI
jgi:hypothetical protein